MLGLEGSGFTICLGVILLLTGVIMYYCKSKITQCEHKVNSMFTLVTALHEEVNTLKIGGARPPPFSISDDNDNDENDENEGILSISTEELPVSNFMNHPYQELIPSQLNQLGGTTLGGTNLGGTTLGGTMNKGNEYESDSSQSESDSDSDEDGDNNTIEIKTVDLSEIEELKIDDVLMVENDGEEDEGDDSGEEGDIKLVLDSIIIESPIDYNKLQVPALKQLVTDRKLASNASKLLKKDLISLLQA
jgi:hypothetical protein